MKLFFKVRIYKKKKINSYIKYKYNKIKLNIIKKFVT